MSVRTSKLKNFQGQEYIVKEDIIDTATGGIKTSLNSLTIKKIAIEHAKKSEIGPAKITPSTPINKGRINIKGMTNIICLVNDKMTPLTGCPIDAKKFDDTN